MILKIQLHAVSMMTLMIEQLHIFALCQYLYDIKLWEMNYYFLSSIYLCQDDFLLRYIVDMIRIS